MKKFLTLCMAMLFAVMAMAGCKPAEEGNGTEPDPDPVEFVPVNTWPEDEPLDDVAFSHADLAWSDEFNGSEIDESKWGFDIGTGSGGWGNNEKQYYRRENARVNGGKLQIIARKEIYGGCAYTSAKLTTKGKFSQTYGKFEARIRVPDGEGFWPAFWMMPADSEYGGWPRSGEIDIMEAKGRLPEKASSAIHYGTTHVYQSKEYMFPGGSTTDDFHIYAVEWTEGRFRFSVDGVVYFSPFNNWDAPGAALDGNAPFDRDFYIILNLAVGGTFDGNRLPANEDFKPAIMEVDYVRVYKVQQ